MGQKVVLSGNQSVSRGFWESGGMVAASYPGSPTVEIMESMRSYTEIHSQWATNEKVALEIAMGASMAGAPAMVSMKHVGINIAADPFMTFTQIKTKGAFVLVVGDDPGLSSSQNEQDSRFWAKYANTALLEPGNPQEAKDYMLEAVKLSEQFHTPVIVRLTSRVCHSRGVVELGQRTLKDIAGFSEDQARYCMLPPYANKQQAFMKERIDAMAAFNCDYPVNMLSEIEGADTLIITSGLPYYYLKELNPQCSIYKLGMVYPLPISRIKALAAKYKKILVLEELMPFIEDALKAEGIPAEGKAFFSYTGELTLDNIKSGLIEAGVMAGLAQDVKTAAIPPRTPMLCAGCPHRPIFHILKKAKAVVMGDIGCYSLGILEPFEVSKTNISMGASLGMTIGVSTVQSQIDKPMPIVGIIGDGTFFHSGMTGFVEIAKTKQNITMIIMDNRTTAMTGGQETPTTANFTGKAEEYHLHIPDILKAFGIKDITVVDQFNYKETKAAILEAMKREQLSVIVTTRPCALNFKINENHFYVDINTCIGCRSCIGVNCPPIAMKQYKGKEKKNSSINPEMCVGCSVCSQVCPVGAIKRYNAGNKA